MKRIAAVAVALTALCAGSAHAQSYATDRGSTLLGGGASWTTTHVTQNVNGVESSSNYTLLDVSPAVQYFVRPGLALGGRANVQHATNSGGTTYGAGPAASYYFGRGERPYYPYVTADAMYSHGNDFHSVTVGGGAGAVFMVSRSVGVDAGLRYNGYSVKLAGESDPAIKGRTFGLTVGFTAFAFGHRPAS